VAVRIHEHGFHTMREVPCRPIAAPQSVFDLDAVIDHESALENVERFLVPDALHPEAVAALKGARELCEREFCRNDDYHDRPTSTRGSSRSGAVARWPAIRNCCTSSAIT